MHRPLSFLDGHLPPGDLTLRFSSSIDLNFQCLSPAPKNYFVNWSHNLRDVDFSLSLDFNNLTSDDLLVFSDGSFKEDVASFGVVIYSGTSWRCDVSLYENHGRLTPQKSILDAEIYGIMEGLSSALRLPEQGRIYLLSDSQSALNMFFPFAPWIHTRTYPTQPP